VWISNHGGRQLDTTRASIDVLADIAKRKIFACKVCFKTQNITGLQGLTYSSMVEFEEVPIYLSALRWELTMYSWVDL